MHRHVITDSSPLPKASTEISMQQEIVVLKPKPHCPSVLGQPRPWDQGWAEIKSHNLSVKHLSLSQSRLQRLLDTFSMNRSKMLRFYQHCISLTASLTCIFPRRMWARLHVPGVLKFSSSVRLPWTNIWHMFKVIGIHPTEYLNFPRYYLRAQEWS